jgi:hypothetical protein
MHCDVADPDKRDCDEMNTIAKLFILVAICCCFAIVISIAGVIDGILGVRQMRRDQVSIDDYLYWSYMVI